MTAVTGAGAYFPRNKEISERELEFQNHIINEISKQKEKMENLGIKPSCLLLSRGFEYFIREIECKKKTEIAKFTEILGLRIVWTRLNGRVEVV